MLKTLTNSFHKTTVRIRVQDSWGNLTQDEIYSRLVNYAKVEGPHGRLSRKVRRIQRTLCGMEDCHCGTVRE